MSLLVDGEDIVGHEELPRCCCPAVARLIHTASVHHVHSTASPRPGIAYICRHHPLFFLHHERFFSFHSFYEHSSRG